MTQSRFDGGFEYRNEHEYTRIARWPCNKNWHLETKLDCYGGTWQTAVGTSSEAFDRVVCIQVTIDIMLHEQKTRFEEMEKRISDLEVHNEREADCWREI